MKSGLAELSACLASLDALLARTRRLVKEYDSRVRKRGYPSDVEIAALDNAISFPEVRSLDELCADALRRWLPERPELAREWYVNTDLGMSSPEDLESELLRKRSRLTFAVQLYRATQTAADPFEEGTERSDVPAAYRKLGDPIRLFFADAENECDVFDQNVFIMTRFQEGNRELNLLDETIRAALQESGLVGHRADDKCYPTDRNLWDNVCTYMFGCKFGIAVLENLVVNEFNPNVALEYGFMRALGKPVLLLKEKRLAPRADVLGTLWEEFDMFDIEKTVSAAIRRWARDVVPGLA